VKVYSGFVLGKWKGRKAREKDVKESFAIKGEGS
jgi:hypothetical protein